MFIIYQIIVFTGLLLASPYLILRAVIGEHGLKERLGLWDFKPDDRKTIWFHAASMGELKTITTILPELFEHDPRLRIIITTVTKTGKARALKLPYPVEAFYLPIDLKPAIDHVLKKVKPSVLVLVETELWPALIRQMHRAGTKIVVANGRISNKSFKFYEFFIAIFSPVIRQLNYIMVQTKKDAEKYIRLGAIPQNVAVYGNTKFDLVLVQDKRPPAKELENYLSIKDCFIFIAGSVRPGEIRSVVEAVSICSRKTDNLKTIIAPRHLKDLKDLEKNLRLSSLKYIKRTDLPKGTRSDVPILVLDTMGELGGLYRFADLAFVGGSLVDVGGHDPLEPASAGTAVCFGPHMDNCRMFADILVDSGGSFYVKNSAELSVLIDKLASDKTLARQLGEKSHQAVLSHSGVSQKIAERLLEST